MMLEEKYDMLSVEDVMELLHLGKNTAYNMLKNKDIKCFKIRGRYKIPKISVYEFIESNLNELLPK